MKEIYTIQDLCLLTGFTDRTLRNHIALGNLEGEKVGNLWQFTPQQVENFLQLPQVWPGIQAKKNAIVYDFLRSKSKKAPRMCVILDLPGKDKFDVAWFDMPEEYFEEYCDEEDLQLEDLAVCKYDLDAVPFADIEDLIEFIDSHPSGVRTNDNGEDMVIHWIC